MTGTALGKRTEAQLTWSPQAPPLLTVAVPLGYKCFLLEKLHPGLETLWCSYF